MMKKLLTTTILAATVGLSFNALAAPGDFASDSFRWGGDIPLLGADGGLVLTPVGGGDFQSGSLDFVEGGATGQYALRSSSQIGVLVTDSSSVPVTDFNIEQQSLTFSVGAAGAQPVDLTTPEFKLIADGTPMVQKTSQTITGTNQVDLQIEGGATEITATPGDTVTVEALVLFTQN